MDISWKAPRCVFVNSTWHGLALQQPVKVHDVVLYYKPIIVKNAVTVSCGCQRSFGTNFIKILTAGTVTKLSAGNLKIMA